MTPTDPIYTVIKLLIEEYEAARKHNIEENSLYAAGVATGCTSALAYIAGAFHLDVDSGDMAGSLRAVLDKAREPRIVPG